MPTPHSLILFVISRFRKLSRRPDRWTSSGSFTEDVYIASPSSNSWQILIVGQPSNSFFMPSSPHAFLSCFLCYKKIEFEKSPTKKIVSHTWSLSRLINLESPFFTFSRDLCSLRIVHSLWYQDQRTSQDQFCPDDVSPFFFSSSLNKGAKR